MSKAKARSLKTTSHGRIVSSLRRLWLFSPERQMAIRSSTFIPGYVRCYVCSLDVSKSQRDAWSVDHLSPCVPVSGWDGFSQFIERLFNGKQLVICTNCHRKKTAIETSARKLGNEGKSPRSR